MDKELKPVVKDVVTFSSTLLLNFLLRKLIKKIDGDPTIPLQIPGQNISERQ